MALSLIKKSLNGSGARRCQSWIESFLAYTEDRGAPEIWRKWVGVSTIAAVLERKVWVTTTLGDLYPNLYVMLVGPPGVGKSDTIKATMPMLRELEVDGKLHVAPNDTSCAALADYLAGAKRTHLRPGQSPPTIDYNACVCVPSEFGNFIPAWDGQMMSFLTTLYDGEHYEQHRRGITEKIKVLRPTLNLLAANTPSHLVKFMPEGAWDQGFASRLIMVYNGDRALVDIFREDRESVDVAYQDLLHDLHIICGLYGRVDFDNETAEAFRTWRAAGLPPEPKHPKLTYYCTRRTAHVLKLAMVISASKGNGLRMSLEDFEEARLMLIEAEQYMPDIFLAGKPGAQNDSMDEAHHFLVKMGAKGIPVTEAKLVHFYRERVPGHSVLKCIELMVAEGSAKVNLDAKTGIKTYIPGPRKPSFD